MDLPEFETTRTAYPYPFVPKDDADLSRIFLTSSSASDAEVKELTALIQSILPFKEVLIGCAGCTIASHCGPGCMGILFMTK